MCTAAIVEKKSTVAFLYSKMLCVEDIVMKGKDHAQTSDR